MKAPIEALSGEETARLAKDIFYLNMAELRQFCESHRIPYRIHAENAEGRIVQSADTDRKGVIMDRILHFLSTGEIKSKTVFRRSVTAMDRPDHPLNASDPVLYRHYRNHDREILSLMKQLTGGKFRFGAVAQEVLRTCWTRELAPTYLEFAKLWEKAAAAHSRPNPEWAFLTDVAKGAAGPDWKKRRSQKATAVVAILRKIR